MRFLVTGATGFVGSHIVIKLLENGHDVNVLGNENLILKKHPKVPLAAVKTAYKFKYYDSSSDAKKLGLDPGPVKLAFEKSIRWFKENGYVKN